MKIAMLDLMPILWILCGWIAVILALHGESGVLARMLPAVLAGMLSYLAGLPPRGQVLLFAGMYAVDTVVWLLLMRILEQRKKRQQTVSDKKQGML